MVTYLPIFGVMESGYHILMVVRSGFEVLRGHFEVLEPLCHESACITSHGIPHLNVTFGQKVDFSEIGSVIYSGARGVRKTRFHLILSSFSLPFGLI